MSAYIEHVEVFGFWGNHYISLPVESDVTFLIGANGSGKTTIINLIAAALTSDFLTLEEIEFEKIRIKLKQKTPYAKPIVEIRKNQSIDLLDSDISFSIYRQSKSSPRRFSMSEMLPRRVRADSTARHRFMNRLSEGHPLLDEELRSLCTVSWLSVTRNVLDSEDRQQWRSSVDRKLDKVSQDLAQYFSGLQKRASVEVEKFQEQIFLSLLSTESENALVTKVKSLDVEEEEKSLSEAFRELGVQERKFQPRMKKHFARIKNALSKIEDKKSVNPDEIYSIVNTLRIHSVVSEWHDLTEERDKIFRPRTIFLETINKLFQRKELCIDDENNLYAVSQSGKNLRLIDLSSGEKQLLILIGESLLQKGEPCIYIADEPELSLHVEWQNQLVPSLKAVNPNVQILFATHSPDIVGAYRDRAVRMEGLIE